MKTKVKIRIGLLEDDHFFADIVKTYLEREKGWKVKIYSSSSKVKKETMMPDLFVFDFMMAMDESLPDSEKLLKWLLSEYPQIPIYCFTNYSSMEAAIELIKGDACKFLLKDVNSINELVKNIKDTIKNRSSRKRSGDIDSRMFKLFSRLVTASTVFVVLGVLLFWFTR